MDEIMMLHAFKESAVAIASIKERLIKLEQIIGQLNICGDLDARLNEFEETINMITQDGMLAERKPWQCPNCIGKGYDSESFHCVSCSGEGIVWG